MQRAIFASCRVGVRMGPHPRPLGLSEDAAGIVCYTPVATVQAVRDEAADLGLSALQTRTRSIDTSDTYLVRGQSKATHTEARWRSDGVVVDGAILTCYFLTGRGEVWREEEHATEDPE